MMMTKEHEQFLFRCELAKTIVAMIWTKGIITDQESDKAIEYLTKKFKEEEITKFIKK